MTQQQPTSSDSAFLRAVKGFFRFLVRFLFVLVVGVLLAAGLYYGAPWVYRNLVQPVQENSVRIATLEQRMDQEQERLREENQALEERITALETELSQLQEEVAVEAQDQQSLEEQHQELADRIAQVEDDLTTQEQAIEEVGSDLEEAVADLEGELADVAGELADAQAQADVLDGRLMLLQAAQDLLKVRLLLFEENERAAQETVALTVTHLDQAIARMPAQAETLEDLRERVAALDELIERNSFRVRPDLEALWADIMELVVPPPSALGGTAQPTPAQSPVPTPTSTP